MTMTSTVISTVRIGNDNLLAEEREEGVLDFSGDEAATADFRARLSSSEPSSSPPVESLWSVTMPPLSLSSAPPPASASSSSSSGWKNCLLLLFPGGAGDNHHGDRSNYTATTTTNSRRVRQPPAPPPSSLDVGASTTQEDPTTMLAAIVPTTTTRPTRWRLRRQRPDVPQQQQRLPLPFTLQQQQRSASISTATTSTTATPVTSKQQRFRFRSLLGVGKALLVWELVIFLLWQTTAHNRYHRHAAPSYYPITFTRVDRAMVGGAGGAGGAQEYKEATSGKNALIGRLLVRRGLRWNRRSATTGTTMTTGVDGPHHRHPPRSSESNSGRTSRIAVGRHSYVVIEQSAADGRSSSSTTSKDGESREDANLDSLLAVLLSSSSSRDNGSVDRTRETTQSQWSSSHTTTYSRNQPLPWYYDQEGRYDHDATSSESGKIQQHYQIIDTKDDDDNNDDDNLLQGPWSKQQPASRLDLSIGLPLPEEEGQLEEEEDVVIVLDVDDKLEAGADNGEGEIKGGGGGTLKGRVDVNVPRVVEEGR